MQKWRAKMRKKSYTWLLYYWLDCNLFRTVGKHNCLFQLLDSNTKRFTTNGWNAPVFPLIRTTISISIAQSEFSARTNARTRATHKAILPWYAKSSDRLNFIYSTFHSYGMAECMCYDVSHSEINKKRPQWIEYNSNNAKIYIYINCVNGFKKLYSIIPIFV